MLDTGAVRWNDDGTMQVGGVSFGVLGGTPSESILLLYKSPDMIDAYTPIVDEFRGARVVELGIFGGGSTGFFALIMEPSKLVAFDLSTRRSRLLDDLVDSQGLADAVRLHYGVDQSDHDTLAAIVDRELEGAPIDLVIDDASHLYGPTVASFEVLFPRVRPGGLYVIEDWLPPTPMIEHFAAVAAQRPSEEASATEALIADQIGDPSRDGGDLFINWFVRAALDAASPHHDVVRRWYEAILQDDQPACQVIRRHLEPLVEAGWDGFRRHPNLTTLGVELVVAAANGDLSGVAEIRISPLWIEVRRSDQELDPGRFRFDEIAYDHFDAMGRPPSAGTA